MGRLELRGLRKIFGAAAALDDIDFQVEPGEILGLTGPSGAGKSTLCRIVAGVERPSAGEVLIDGTPMTAVPPDRRRVAFMFESYALYPHLTVFENVAFPLRAPGAPRRTREQVAALVRELIELVELRGLEDRRPGELSGGQKQRVALCRALVQAPRTWLLDEPISQLDAKLRHVLRGAIRQRLVRTEVPAIWTSPDALEALAVADRIAVLVEGRVRQVGAPGEVYWRPASVAVARLFGDPPMNLLEGTIAENGGDLVFRHAAFTVTLPRPLRARLQSGRRLEGVVLGLRPAEIRIAAAGGRTQGRVRVWEPLGKYGILTVGLGPDVVKVKVAPARSWQPGEAVALDLEAAEPALFDAVTECAL
jgi:multiple sugar transport system ATP-binding protein